MCVWGVFAELCRAVPCCVIPCCAVPCRAVPPRLACSSRGATAQPLQRDALQGALDAAQGDLDAARRDAAEAARSAAAMSEQQAAALARVATLKTDAADALEELAAGACLSLQHSLVLCPTHSACLYSTLCLSLSHPLPLTKLPQLARRRRRSAEPPGSWAQEPMPWTPS
jgi:hypothetical protein